MNKSTHDVIARRTVFNLTVALFMIVLTACSTTSPTPVVTVVEKTVVVVVTATNPPASATPAQTATPAATAAPAATATLAETPTAAATETVADTATPAPTTGPILAETLKPTVTRTSGPKTFPTVVPIVQATLNGIFPGDIRYLPVASTQMNLEYMPHQAVGGPRVTSIGFSIFNATQLVYSSVDNVPPYCAFGDNGKTCSPLLFGNYVNTWPGTHLPVRTGDYVLKVTVQDNETINNTWNTTVSFKIKLP